MAQGTSWAVAVTQAFLDAGSIPCMCVRARASLIVLVPVLFVGLDCLSSLAQDASILSKSVRVCNVCACVLHMCCVHVLVCRTVK